MARRDVPDPDDIETVTADEFRDLVENPEAAYDAMGVEFVNLTYADILDLFDKLEQMDATCEVECIPSAQPQVASITVTGADTMGLYYVATFLRNFGLNKLMQFDAELDGINGIRISFALGT